MIGEHEMPRQESQVYTGHGPWEIMIEKHSTLHPELAERIPAWCQCHCPRATSQLVPSRGEGSFSLPPCHAPPAKLTAGYSSL